MRPLRSAIVGLALALPASQAAAAEAAGLGGPSSVQGQIEQDEEARRAPVPGISLPFKDRLQRDYGLGIGADYQALYQHATESPGKKDASGGVFRVYGEWAPGKRAGATDGSLVFKGEYRHRYSSIPPKSLAANAGISGLTAVPFSDAGWILTNFYWVQHLAENRFGFAAGVVDVTDYLDVYGLVNPWTEFNNYAFTTSPTIPAPDQGLGAAMRWSFTPNIYVLGGVADANGDPGDPGNSFNSFFNTHELFKHVEFGWVGSWEKRFSDNVHISAWQQDAREALGIRRGSGVTVSFSRELGERWLPFFRGGHSDGGGALLEDVVSAGVGYKVNARTDYVGVGASWGRAPVGANGDRGRDQYTFEAYYRLQVLKGVQITPDVQWIRNPAYNTSVDNLWIVGLRLRLAI